MTDPRTPTDLRMCRFPGCDQVAAATGDGTSGRPSEYCSNAAHTRAAAWRLRQRQDSPATAAPSGVSEEERLPIDAARLKAGALRGQVQGMVELLSTQLSSLMSELHNMADPGAAEAQIDSITADANEQVAAATARASRAELAQTAAETERADADVAAHEAVNTAIQLEAEITALRQELAETTAAALTATTAAAEREHTLHAAVGEAEAHAAAAHAQLLTATLDRDALQGQLADAGTHLRDASDRASLGEGTITALREQLAQLIATHTAIQQKLTDSIGIIATARAERDAANAAATRETVHANQRVDDVRATYLQQISELRTGPTPTTT